MNKFTFSGIMWVFYGEMFVGQCRIKAVLMPDGCFKAFGN